MQELYNISNGGAGFEAGAPVQLVSGTEIRTFVQTVHSSVSVATVVFYGILPQKFAAGTFLRTIAVAEMNNMSLGWKEIEDEEAAGANCPRSDCGALVVAYRPTDHNRRDNVWWDFTCPRCGVNFSVSEDELIFQAVPKHWLLGTFTSCSRA